jgi:predicted ATPase
VVAGHHDVERLHGQAGRAQVGRRAGVAIQQIADLDDPEAIPPAVAGVQDAQRPEQCTQHIRSRVHITDDNLNHAHPT